MELWDLYDKDRNLLGKDHIRGEEIPKGCYHIVVHVWIQNSKGEYLISQRAADRPAFPLMWETVGGSVIKGENSLQGACRETLEEIGVVLSPENGRRIRSVIRDTGVSERFGNILDTWLFTYDGEANPEKATTAEVAQTVWMSKEQVRKLHEQGKLVPTLAYFFEMEAF